MLQNLDQFLSKLFTDDIHCDLNVFIGVQVVAFLDAFAQEEVCHLILNGTFLRFNRTLQ